MPKTNKLTPKQELFCQELMVDNNATQAYLRVYGCSLKAAEAGASRALRIVKVKARVKELRKKVVEKTQVTVESVIEDIVDTRRRAKDDDNYNAELKASDMLAKHVGAYEKNNEQLAGLTLTDIAAIVAGKAK